MDSLPAASEKPAEDGTRKNNAGQCTVICVYQTKLAGQCRNVTVTWSKNYINHSLNIFVETSGSETHHTCKIDLKPWHFWSKKGFKSFEVDGSRVDVFWDLRSAKLSSGSEPTGDYYVAVVCDEEVVLLLGDCKKEAYRRTKSRPSLIDATLVSKRETVYGKKCFCTRAKFDQRRKQHDIVVENSITGSRDPEMWISIDGIVLIHVTNLQWKFRGNDTVFVNQVPVQVFWDVYDWLFCSPGTGHALFIFKPGALDCGSDDDRSGHADSGGGDDETEYFSAHSRAPPVLDFSLFLYACKVE